jgi:hypothetical protein
MRSRVSPRRGLSRVVWPAAIAAVVLALVRHASADFPSVNARQFQPPLDPNGSLYLEPALTPGPGAFNGALWFVYAHRPAVLRDPSGDIVAHLVENQVSSDLVLNLGLGDRLAFGLDLPFLIYQAGDDNAITRAVAGGPPPHQAFGDLAFVAKGNLVSYESLGGFGLSTLLRFTTATGDTASYLSEGTETGELRLLAEYNLIAASLQATGGFKLRLDEQNVIGQTYDSQFPWGAAIALRPQAWGWDDKGRWRWVAEIHGSALLPPSQSAKDMGQTTPTSPVTAGLSARFSPSDFSFLLGVETSLTKALGNPPFQAIASVQWAPREHDHDHDGVADDVDQCPELAEDRDGFQDADGCPDWDNDDDGVADASDRCPTQKEDADGFQDDDGCPDPDNDKDGIPDTEDACPNEPGDKSANRKVNGCPDRDKDGVADKLDKCPDQPEDVDGFEDADGCPDPDNDKDGVVDADDKCPNVPAGLTPDPQRPGCPATDRDGDTIADSVDKCPDEPETWNGVEDADGCPDTGGKPLVAVTQKNGDLAASFAQGIKLKGSLEAPEVDAASVPALRALAAELNHNPQWIVAVGVRPKKDGPIEQQAALAQAFAVVEVLHKYTYRDGVAETVGWKAVAKQPGAAASGFGVLLLAPRAEAPKK